MSRINQIQFRFTVLNWWNAIIVMHFEINAREWDRERKLEWERINNWVLAFQIVYQQTIEIKDILDNTLFILIKKNGTCSIWNGISIVTTEWERVRVTETSNTNTCAEEWIVSLQVDGLELHRFVLPVDAYSKCHITFHQFFTFSYALSA